LESNGNVILLLNIGSSTNDLRRDLLIFFNRKNIESVDSLFVSKVMLNQSHVNDFSQMRLENVVIAWFLYSIVI